MVIIAKTGLVEKQMDFFEDKLISLKAIEERFGKTEASKKILQIFEMLNKLKFYKKTANPNQEILYMTAIANLRIAIEEELKTESTCYVK